MPNYAVASSAADYTAGNLANTTGVVLTAEESFLEPSLSSKGLAEIDTSPIGTDVISAAVLHYYQVAQTRSPKTMPWSRIINILGHGNIFTSSATPPSAGWQTLALSGGQLLYINKTGITTLEFATTVDSEIAVQTWTVQSWDYSDHSRACYLAVTHAAAGGPTKFSILR